MKNIDNYLFKRTQERVTQLWEQQTTLATMGLYLIRKIRDRTAEAVGFRVAMFIGE
ncbi:hypothetical protein [Spirosoma arcticum]